MPRAPLSVIALFFQQGIVRFDDGRHFPPRDFWSGYTSRSVHLTVSLGPLTVRTPSLESAA